MKTIEAVVKFPDLIQNISLSLPDEASPTDIYERIRDELLLKADIEWHEV